MDEAPQKRPSDQARSRALRLAVTAAHVLVASSLLGCAGSLESLGAALAYRGADLPREQVHTDLAYRSGAEADPEKHRLDLFLPAPGIRNFPTLVFIHGGGWTHGDRETGFGSIRPYRNIGRFYARRGIAVAVPSYRLQPGVDWQEQLQDVAAATKWVREQISEYGGNADAIVLSGHSAGAWLAARLAFDADTLRRAGVPTSSLCGVVLVSGAAYDLRDEGTYALGASRDYFEARFSNGAADWTTRASVIPAIEEQPSTHRPPTLIVSAAGEPPTFERQSDLLYQALRESRAPARRLIVPGMNHQRIVIALSREDGPVSSSLISHLERTTCSETHTARPAAPTP